MGGAVTPATLFRGQSPGDLVGPYISQFLWKIAPYGTTPIVQIQNNPVPGDDHVTTYNEWLNIQNGLAPTGTPTFDPVKRYIRTARDLAEWLRVDFTYQGVLNAFNILLGHGSGPRRRKPVHGVSDAAWIRHVWPAALSGLARVRCECRAQSDLVPEVVRPSDASGRRRLAAGFTTTRRARPKYPLHADILNSPVLAGSLQPVRHLPDAAGVHGGIAPCIRPIRAGTPDSLAQVSRS